MQYKKILTKLKKIENELKSRQEKNKILLYNKNPPFHNKQIAFHKAPQTNRWVFGGNRSGKTECGAVEVIYMARGIHPYRKNKKSVTGWVVSLSQQVQRDVAQTKILHYLNPDWIVDIVMLSGKKDNPKNGVIELHWNGQLWNLVYIFSESMKPRLEGGRVIKGNWKSR